MNAPGCLPSSLSGLALSPLFSDAARPATDQRRPSGRVEARVQRPAPQALPRPRATSRVSGQSRPRLTGSARPRRRSLGICWPAWTAAFAVHRCCPSNTVVGQQVRDRPMRPCARRRGQVLRSAGHPAHPSADTVEPRLHRIVQRPVTKGVPQLRPLERVCSKLAS